MVCCALAPKAASDRTVETVRREIHPARVVMRLSVSKALRECGRFYQALKRLAIRAANCAASGAASDAAMRLAISLCPRCRANSRNARRDVLPCRLAACELLTQVGHQLGDLGVVETVAVSRHRTEFGPCRRADTIEDHANQIIRRRAMQIRVERQRR